jgi:pimeloyl-ACP methyl ester carboxylesterase
MCPNAVKERQVLIPSGEGRLAGMLHLPEGDARPTGLVLCAPFGDERKSAWRALTQLSRSVARAGWPVVRFDYRGCGESPGDFIQATLETRLNDIVAAGEYLERELGLEQLCVAGLRLGATLAAGAGAELPGCCAAVLIEPVPEGRRYFGRMLQRKKLRQSITSGQAEQDQGGDAVDLDGYAVRREVLEELQGVELSLPEYHPIGSALLAQVSFNEKLRSETEHAREVLEEGGVEVSLRTLVMEPFWSRIDITDTGPLDEAVVEWLEEEGL